MVDDKAIHRNVFVHVMCMRENDAGSLTLVQRDTHDSRGRMSI